MTCGSCFYIIRVVLRNINLTNFGHYFSYRNFVKEVSKLINRSCLTCELGDPRLLTLRVGRGDK